MSDARKTSDWWNTIDFRPAPPGWRVVFLWDTSRETVHIAGWLIQERYTQDADDPYTLHPELGDDEDVFGRRRRIIPGFVSEGHYWTIEAVDENLGAVGNIWRMLAPGVAEPTDEEEQEERARRVRKASRGKP